MKELKRFFVKIYDFHFRGVWKNCLFEPFWIIGLPKQQPASIFFLLNSLPHLEKCPLSPWWKVWRFNFWRFLKSKTEFFMTFGHFLSFRPVSYSDMKKRLLIFSTNFFFRKKLLLKTFERCMKKVVSEKHETEIRFFFKLLDILRVPRLRWKEKLVSFPFESSPSLREL